MTQKSKTEKKDFKWISDFNIYSAKKNKDAEEKKVRVFDLDNHEANDLRECQDERINTVNR